MSVSKLARRAPKPVAPVQPNRVSVSTFNSAPEIMERRNQRTTAYKHLTRLTNNKGATHLDWFSVHVRVYMGAMAHAEYFNHDDDVRYMFELALHALEIAAVRASITDDMGLNVTEANCVREAFEIVDALYELLTLHEMKRIVKIAKAVYTDVANANKQSALTPEQAKQHMLNQLAVEYQQAGK